MSERMLGLAVADLERAGKGWLRQGLRSAEVPAAEILAVLASPGARVEEESSVTARVGWRLVAGGRCWTWAWSGQW